MSGPLSFHSQSSRLCKAVGPAWVGLAEWEWEINATQMSERSDLHCTLSWYCWASRSFRVSLLLSDLLFTTVCPLVRFFGGSRTKHLPLLLKNTTNFFFWLRWVFIAACGFYLVAASGGYSLVAVCGFLIAFYCGGFSCFGSQTLQCRLSSCGTGS